MSSSNVSAVNKLKALNILSPVLLEEKFVNNMKKKLSKNLFALVNGYPRMQKHLTTSAVTNDTLSSATYNRFDNYGNLIEMRKEDLPLTVYLYGYAGHYPVGMIENATYSQVLSILGQSVIDNLNLINVSDETIRSAMNTLRTRPNMKNSKISSYAYKPLVGMTSMTDLNGVTEYYSYDSFGRLEYVKDFQGNIIKVFSYNYKGEQLTSVTYLNAAQSITLTKNDCPSGQTGDYGTYTVAAGSYMSTISQADANQKALDDIAHNGQTYVNSHTSCTVPVVYVDVMIEKETGWNGQIGRVSFYKNGSNAPEFEVFPSNSGSSETISVPAGEYSRIRINLDGTGTPYNGMLSIINANPTPCEQISQSNVELNFYNIKFQGNSDAKFVVAEYCMN